MLIPFFFFGQSKNQELELTALRQSNNFSKPYRILKTTISDQSLFQEIYNDTDFTLDYVIRYNFYTSIDLNAKKNQLVSMDGTTFNLSSKNAKDLTDAIETYEKFPRYTEKGRELGVLIFKITRIYDISE